jgi:hypothetical protein
MGLLSTLLITLSAILITYTAIRGLPEEFQSRIRKEFRQRGLMVDWDFVGLDPLARITVKNFRCRGIIPGRESTIIIQQAFFDVGWLSFIRSEQILKAITINNASFQFLTGTGEKILIENLNASALFTPEKIIVNDLIAASGRATLNMQGEIPLSFFTSENQNKRGIPEITNQEAHRSDEKKTDSWEIYAKKLLNTFDRSALQTKINITPQSGISWDAVAISLTADAQEADFEGVHWQALSLRANWQQGALTLDQLFLKTHNGFLSLAGSWNSTENATTLELFINSPPETLLPLLPEEIAKRLKKISTYGSFTLEASASFHTQKISENAIHGRMEWLSVTLGDQVVDEISIPFHFVGGRLEVPAAKVEADGEILEIKASSNDVAWRITAQAKGLINPSKFRHLLPEADDFFNSTIFKTPLELTFEGNLNTSASWEFLIQGEVSVGELIYKGVEIVSASSKLELAPPLLKLANLQLQRREGQGFAEAVEYNYAVPYVRLTNVKTSFFTIPTARIFGPKLEEYLSPYTFPSPPEIRLDGFIDLASEKLTDLKISARGDQFRYHLLGRDIPGKKFTTQLTLQANRLQISTLKARVDDGALDLKGSFLLQPNNTSYELAFALRDADFSSLMRGFFNLDNITGRITGNANLSGKLEELRSMRGQGQVSVREGSLIDIPFLGALSQVAGLIELGKARASEADATFQIENGKIFTGDLDIRSVTMALIGNGYYDFVDDQMQLDVRLNVRGPAGLVLFPVSKLFEYRGTGSLANTKWEPKMFTPAVPILGSAQGIAPSVRGRNR